MTSHHTRPRWAAAAIAALAMMTLAACASGGTSDGTDGSPAQSAATADSATGGAAETATETTAEAETATETAGEPRSVTLLTHGSFAVDPQVLEHFQAESGIQLQILSQGDAGEALSKAIVTKGNPLGDVIFGIDNTLATKALDAGILQPYTSPLADRGSDRFAIGGDQSDQLTAVDFGDVCVNVDHQYFADAGLTEPVTFEDLADPAYRDMLVVEDAATSSPGLAFLFATVAHFGQDGWMDYWTALKDNGVLVAGGWTDAYTVAFSGSSGHGDRPLVVSYASSPPSEVPDGADEAPTGALLDTCFRQVEYAGVLAGTADPAAAGAVIDFLLSDEFQQQIPGQMWMYPVDKSVPLPEDWQRFAPTATDVDTLDPALIDANRQQWIDDWSDLMQG